MFSISAMKSTLTGLMTSLLLTSALLPSEARAADPVTHLDWARLLVNTISPAQNDYESNPTEVRWKGYDGNTESYNRSRCSSFFTSLLVKAYDEDLTGWLGCSSPIANTYHDAIEAEDGFIRITDIAELQVGDVLALAYNDAGCTEVTCGSVKTCTNSGHVMIVSSAPALRTATAPVIANTSQYELKVIDSSSAFHGSGDTRYMAEANGTHDKGVGEGTIRLYVNNSGEVTGHTWSTSSGSTYYTTTTRSIMMGRYDR